MFAALADLWPLPADSAAPRDTGPRPPRYRPPVLIGDILNARCGEPELLIRWREDRDRDVEGDC